MRKFNNYINIFILIFIGCNMPIGRDQLLESSIIEIMEGKEKLINEIKQMKSYKGILPNFNIKLSENIIIKDNFYEYFVFDQQTVLFLMDVKSYIFIKVKSSKLFYHLNSEWCQYKKNPNLIKKYMNTEVFYIGKGDESRIGVFFTPNELYFLKNGKNKGRIKELWPYIYASDQVVSYFPEFSNEVLFKDFYEHIKDDKLRVIYASDSSFPPIFYSKISLNLGFSVIIGKSIKEDYLMKYNKNFLNLLPAEKKIILKDFVLFNSNNFQDSNNGYSLFIQGNIKKILTWLLGKGIPLNKKVVNNFPKEPKKNDLFITEVMWMGTYYGDNGRHYDEWFEIKNRSNNYLDVSELEIYIDNYLIKIDGIKGNKIIGPGEYLVIARSEKYLFENKKPKLFWLGAFGSSGLKNEGDYKIVIKNKKSVIHELEIFKPSQAGLNDIKNNTRKSMVLMKDSTWENSNTRVLDEEYKNNTYGTPGYNKKGEM